MLSCRHFRSVTDSVLLHRRLHLRRRDIPVSRNSLVWRYTARHLRIRRLVAIYPRRCPVYYNALKNCAARLCRALRRVTRMCSSTLSVNCEQVDERHGRKNPSAVSPFRSGRSLADLRQTIQQGKGRSPKRKENRRLSFLFAHRRGYGVVPAAGRGTFPPSADGESLAEVQRKTLRPLGANTPAAVRAPRSAGAEKEPPRQGEPACGSSSAPHNRCRKGAARKGRTRLRQFVRPAQPVQRKEPPRQGEHADAVRVPRWVGAEKISRKFSKKLTIPGQFSPPSGIGLKEVTQ